MWTELSQLSLDPQQVLEQRSVQIDILPDADQGIIYWPSCLCLQTDSQGKGRHSLDVRSLMPVSKVNLDIYKAPLNTNAFSKASQIWQHTSCTCKQRNTTQNQRHCSINQQHMGLMYQQNYTNWLISWPSKDFLLHFPKQQHYLDHSLYLINTCNKKQTLSYNEWFEKMIIGNLGNVGNKTVLYAIKISIQCSLTLLPHKA